MDSLRLLFWAGAQQRAGLQEALADELAVGHFERKECVADHDVLLRACAKVGCSVQEQQEAALVLQGDRGKLPQSLSIFVSTPPSD